MTTDERAREADRLMAILQGEWDATLITETGDIQAPEPEEDELPSCVLCFGCIEGDEIRRIDDLPYCEDCAEEAEKLSRRQAVCPLCDGKRLRYGLAEPDAPRPSWYPCEMCAGKGWVSHLALRLNETQRWNEMLGIL
jgi:hypothetical protein